MGAFVVDWDSHGDFVGVPFAFPEFHRREAFHEIRLGCQVRILNLLAGDYHGFVGVLVGFEEELGLVFCVAGVGGGVVFYFDGLGCGFGVGEFLLVGSVSFAL